MAYRNGTYVAFHAEGNSDPTDTDQRYYRMLAAWKASDKLDFYWINSHDKTAAVRDTSKRATLAARLQQRLASSRNLLLIIGSTTRLDTDWVPFEIRQAIETYEIPIIAAYPGYGPIFNPSALRSLWPTALATRIDNNTAHVIHVPFKQEPIKDAISQFDHNNYPRGGGLGTYTAETYMSWRMLNRTA
jgi:hypothetical protein